MIVTEAIQQRFWSNVALPNEDGCMLWTGSKNVYRYGRLPIQGRYVGAHRIALCLSDGPPPEDKPEAAHSCRNRHCVAPEHLRWADRLEQSQDKRRDGTSLHGEKHGQAKLTAEQVKQIRARYAGGTLQQPLAEEYGVDQTQVSRIVRLQRWCAQ